MKSVSTDARTFVEGVVSHLKQSGKAKAAVPQVQSLLYKMTAGAKREHEARVESVVKLTSSELQALSRMLSRISGHDVRISCEITPSLLGGLRITMGDWVMDVSVRNELSEMARIAMSS